MNNHWFRKIFMACAAAFSIVTLVAGCGGGGGGTASGSGGGGATSTLILQVASVNGRTALLLPHAEPTGAGRVVTTISTFFLSDAWAATAGVEVYLDGILQGYTDIDGQIMFPITGGVHTIRLSYTDPVTGLLVEASFDITIEEDSIITIPDITVNDDGTISYGTAIYDNDTGPGIGKFTLCHKAKKTLSVGTPAVAAHLAHGDVVGACAAPVPGENGGNNGNNGNGGKKDK